MRYRFLLPVALFVALACAPAVPASARTEVPQLSAHLTPARARAVLTKWRARYSRRAIAGRVAGLDSRAASVSRQPVLRNATRVNLPRPTQTLTVIPDPKQSFSNPNPNPNPNPSPSPRPSPPSVPVSSTVLSIRTDMLRLINDVRTDAGLPSLTANPFLDASAQLYAKDMSARVFFSHTDPDGHSSTDRIRAAGYLTPPCDCNWTFWTGENLASKQKTAVDAMTDWMNSPGHRANILSSNYDDVGIGYEGGYWVQHFGRVVVD